jgi:Carbohydrate binding module (family 6)
MKMRTLFTTLVLSVVFCLGVHLLAAPDAPAAPATKPAASLVPPPDATDAVVQKPFTMDTYKGKPYHDSVYKGGPQSIPGCVQCAYYDLGGEGVAYHDDDAKNLGSGGLNPANPKDASLKYVNEFRMDEGVDTSYTKFRAGIDDNPFDLYTPPEHQMYVGWTNPGEWFNITVNIKEAGTYAVDLLHTSAKGGAIGLDIDGKPLGDPIKVMSTFNDKETVQWRNWHHWNYAKDTADVQLPKGLHVLTVRVVDIGNMNLAFLVFYPKTGATAATPTASTATTPAPFVPAPSSTPADKATATPPQPD